MIRMGQVLNHNGRDVETFRNNQIQSVASMHRHVHKLFHVL